MKKRRVRIEVNTALMQRYMRFFMHCRLGRSYATHMDPMARATIIECKGKINSQHTRFLREVEL